MKRSKFKHIFSGWCAEKGIVLNKPKGYRGDFSWERYLEETRSKAVPNWAFKSSKHESTQFKKGMKLEVVDKWNPIFVRVATVTDVAMRQIKVHFDGWPHDSFDFWIEDDSPNLHPTNWCNKTGHPLMPPLSKKFFFCTHGQKSSIYPEIHIFKTSFLTKFIFSKYHF